MLAPAAMPEMAAADPPAAVSRHMSKPAPRSLPPALAKRGPSRPRPSGARPLARASAMSWNFYQPTVCHSSWMLTTLPTMGGYGSEANWVSVQQAIVKLENGAWRYKAWGPALYARARDTYTTPRTAWVYQDNSPAPNEMWGAAYWGWGQYAMVHYLRWYDGYNNPVGAPRQVWGQHSNGGIIDDLCDLHSLGGIG
jgi:hypothetical protein